MIGVTIYYQYIRAYCILLMQSSLEYAKCSFQYAFKQDQKEVTCNYVFDLGWPLSEKKAVHSIYYNIVLQIIISD